MTKNNPLAQHRWALSVLFLAVIGTYGASLFNGFVWDDYLSVVHNRFIQSPANLPRLFSRSYLTKPSDLVWLEHKDIGSGELTYRPLVTLSFFLDFWIWRLRAFGYHLTNLLWHLAAVGLVYRLAWRLRPVKTFALLTALIFALHPMQAEAVLTISFREDLLAAVFFLAAFLSYLRSYDGAFPKRWIVLSYFCYGLAMLAKEMAVTLPALVFVYDACFRWKDRSSWRGRVRVYAGFWLVLGIYLWVWGVLMHRETENILHYPGDSLYVNFLTMITIFARYAWWFFWPPAIHPTLPDARLFVTTFWDPRVVAALGWLMGLLGVALFWRRRRPLISFAILSFFVTMAPVANLIPLANLMASRYLYIGGIGFCLVAGRGLEAFLDGKTFAFTSMTFRRWMVVILLGFYAVEVLTMTLQWKNEITLRRTFLRFYPQDPRAHRNMGGAYARFGRWEQAIAAVQQAQRLAPRDITYSLDLAELYERQGQLPLALKELSMVLKRTPDNLTARQQRCLILARTRSPETEACYQDFLKDYPDHLVAYYNFGLFLSSSGNLQKAIEVWRAGARRQPNYVPIQKALLILQQQGGHP